MTKFSMLNVVFASHNHINPCPAKPGYIIFEIKNCRSRSTLIYTLKENKFYVLHSSSVFTLLTYSIPVKTKYLDIVEYTYK